MTTSTLKPVKKVLEDEPWLTRNRLYKEMNDGKIEAVKVGNRTFIRDESVQRRKLSLPGYQPLSQRVPSTS